MRAYIIAAILFSAVPAFGADKFTLQSTDVKDGGTVDNKQVFNAMGCKGDNLSPELSWSNPPAGTKSFSISVYDPDAPTGSGWWHWVVYNIPADTKELPQGAGSGKAALPAGAVQGKTDFGAASYGGPCPPPGGKPHHYIFTINALKVDKLSDKTPDPTAAMVGYMNHIESLGSATLTATYGR
jgi:Raf kinase inhibitor-like YbhB/YbcL family protein